MKATIYHNPKCSKSRAALELLHERDIDTHVVEYLKTPPSKQELMQVVSLLGISPRELLRKNEAEYKEHGLDDPDLTDNQLIDIIAKFPKLMERPVTVIGHKACIARPLEKLVNILS